MTPETLARKWCPHHIEPNIALWPCHCVATAAAVREALKEAEQEKQVILAATQFAVKDALRLEKILRRAVDHEQLHTEACRQSGVCWLADAIAALKGDHVV